MLNLHRLSQRRIPALIALMAILMLFIAPEVSKTLEHRRLQSDNVVMQSSSEEMDGMDMAMMPMHQGMSHEMTMPDHNMQGQAAPGSAPLMFSFGGSMMDDIACGYCQLLAHFPVLAWVVLPVIFLLLLKSRPSPPDYTPTTPATVFPGIAQPRAPPAF